MYFSTRYELIEVDQKYAETTYVSARTIRVLLAFSIVNFVLPSWPAIRPAGWNDERSRIVIGQNSHQWLVRDGLRVTFSRP